MSHSNFRENIFKTIFFVIIVVFLIVYFPYKIATYEGRTIITEIGRFRFLGLIFILFGIIGYLASFWGFIFEAESSPIPGDPPKHLIVKGIYRYVRNPIYISHYFVLFGEALFFQSLELFYYLFAWIVFFYIFVILIEEPFLRDRFGDKYDQYCKTVGRWIPRIKLSNQDR